MLEVLLSLDSYIQCCNSYRGVRAPYETLSTMEKYCFFYSVHACSHIVSIHKIWVVHSLSCLYTIMHYRWKITWPVSKAVSLLN